jgi:DNA-binding FrmR family transcriptional regulator
LAGYSTDKKDLQDRLRRIEGQVRGIQRMVEEDTYCIDVLHCVTESIEAGGGDEKVEELLAAVARFAGR